MKEIKKVYSGMRCITKARNYPKKCTVGKIDNNICEIIWDDKTRTNGEWSRKTIMRDMLEIDEDISFDTFINIINKSSLSQREIHRLPINVKTLSCMPPKYDHNGDEVLYIRNKKTIKKEDKKMEQMTVEVKIVTGEEKVPTKSEILFLVNEERRRFESVQDRDNIHLDYLKSKLEELKNEIKQTNNNMVDRDAYIKTLQLVKDKDLIVVEMSNIITSDEELNNEKSLRIIGTSTELVKINKIWTNVDSGERYEIFCRLNNMAVLYKLTN